MIPDFYELMILFLDQGKGILDYVFKTIPND